RQKLQARALRPATVRTGRCRTGEDLARALAPVLEESAQQRRRRLLADAGIDLWPMQALRLIENPRAVLDRAALGIGRAVIEPRDAGVHDGARAHRARL